VKNPKKLEFRKATGKQEWSVVVRVSPGQLWAIASFIRSTIQSAGSWLGSAMFIGGH
jgi:hypothetical protein